uniref:Uncharacterized protein n=1 Tax=Glossina austeni TaxID=7395 RepID=A0A1A9UL75_GLOAU
MDHICYQLAIPERSNSIRPFSVPINKFTPQSAAHRISELKRFLYFRISGVSLEASCDVGVTLTLTCDSRRDGPEPPAPKPNVKKLHEEFVNDIVDCGELLDPPLPLPPLISNFDGVEFTDELMAA